MVMSRCFYRNLVCEVMKWVRIFSWTPRKMEQYSNTVYM